MNYSLRRNPPDLIQKGMFMLRTDGRFSTVGAYMAKMRFIRDDSVGTACTDGLRYIKVAPTYVNGLPSVEHVVSVYVHEILHKHWSFFPRFERWAKQYPGVDRRKLLDIFNRAQDLLINWYIKHRFNLPIMDGWLYDPAFNPDKITCEKIADDLMKEQGDDEDPPDQPGGDEPCEDGEGGSGSGDAPTPNDQPDQPEESDTGQEQDEPSDGPPQQSTVGQGGDIELPEEYNGDINNVPSPQQLADMERQDKMDTADALRMAKANGQKGQGSMAGGVDPFAQDLQDKFKPEFDFREALMWMADRAADHGENFTWFFRDTTLRTPQGMAMPSEDGQQLGTVVFAIDSSGSCDDDAVRYYVAEITKALHELDYERAVIIWCDTVVQKVFEHTKDEVESGAIQTGVRYGSGGTSFDPVFRYVAEHYDDVTCITYLTDGGVCQRDVDLSHEICVRELNNPPVLYLCIQEGWGYEQDFIDMVRKHSPVHRAALLPSRLWS